MDFDALDESGGPCAATPKCVAVGRDRPGLLLGQGQAGAGAQPGVLPPPAGPGRKLGLPAIVHDRDAHRDTLDIAMEFPNVKGVFHCCAFCVPDALEAIDMGWMLSFTGNVTFQTARRVPEVVAAVPLERIMLGDRRPLPDPRTLSGGAQFLAVPLPGGGGHC